MTEVFQGNMQTVRVSRTVLLAKLKENRDKHVAEYEAAKAGYNNTIIAILDRMLKKAKKDPSTFASGLAIYEQPPQSHQSDYDSAIAMLEFSLDDSIVMTSQEVQQYIQDNWQWKQAFAGSVAKYSNVH